MSGRKVLALHHFRARPDSRELSLIMGELLTVLEENTGDGWLEGENAQGNVGYFPADYVTTHHETLKSETSTAAPIVPQRRSQTKWDSLPNGEWRMSTFMPSSSTKNSPSLPRAPPKDFVPAPEQNKIQSSDEEMEDYVLGSAEIKERSGEKHKIAMIDDVIQWTPVLPAYGCTVGDPKKESKLKGLKSFITYTISSTVSHAVVSRRYKHFDWLYDRFRVKYCLIAIPPLPEKQLSGRFEEELIDHRRHILQIWVDKICRHPVLSQSEVWLHFITCIDKKQWKIGKRKAEKDEYIGGNFLHCVKFPRYALNNTTVERHMESFLKDVKLTEDAIIILQERLLSFQKIYKGPVVYNWEKMAAALVTMGESYNQATLNYSAQQFRVIGKNMAEETSVKIETILEHLFSLKGTLQAVPDILTIHKQCVQKTKDNEGRLRQSEEENLRRRVTATSYAMLAELNHLEKEKDEIMQSTMATFLSKQADMYKNVANEFALMSHEFES